MNVEAGVPAARSKKGCDVRGHRAGPAADIEHVILRPNEAVSLDELRHLEGRALELSDRARVAPQPQGRQSLPAGQTPANSVDRADGPQEGIADVAKASRRFDG